MDFRTGKSRLCCLPLFNVILNGRPIGSILQFARFVTILFDSIRFHSILCHDGKVNRRTWEIVSLPQQLQEEKEKEEKEEEEHRQEQVEDHNSRAPSSAYIQEQQHHYIYQNCLVLSFSIIVASSIKDLFDWKDTIIWIESNNTIQ